MWIHIFLFLFFCVLLSCTTCWAQPPFSPLFPALPTFPKIHCVSVSLQKRAGLPVISTKHGLPRFNKNRHKTSHEDSKSMQKSQRDILTFRSSTKPQAKQPQNVYRGHSLEPYRFFHCPISWCEPLWALISWLRCHVLLVPSTPLGSYHSSSFSFSEFPKLHLLFVGLCICSYQLLEESCLIVTGIEEYH